MRLATLKTIYQNHLVLKNINLNANAVIYMATPSIMPQRADVLDSVSAVRCQVKKRHTCMFHATDYVCAGHMISVFCVITTAMYTNNVITACIVTNSSLFHLVNVLLFLIKWLLGADGRKVICTQFSAKPFRVTNAHTPNTNNIISTSCRTYLNLIYMQITVCAVAI